jgi:hypothetical protein
MTDFRARGFEAPLGIGKPNVGDPIPDRYRASPLEAPDPEPTFVTPKGPPKPRGASYVEGLL